MLANYHTHTARCHHAFGTDEEYVIAAIKAGYDTLGFSDHAPFHYPDSYESYYKMMPDELRDYVGSVRALREKYADKIEIHLGLEAEFYPELWEGGLELWRKCGIEYLILGQHFIGKEYDGGRRATATADEVVLRRYTDLCVAAIETEKFSYIAHPDVLNYVGDGDIYKHEVLRLTECAIRHGIPLELNLLGLYENRNYPSARFWEIAAELHPTVIIGDDAHTPLAFERAETRARALAFLEKYGLHPTDALEFRPI